MRLSFRGRLTAVFATVLLSLGILAFANSPAKADTSTGWYNNYWLKAVSGGGCAFSSPGAGAGYVMYSGPCGQMYSTLSYRIITRTNGQQVIQIARPAYSVDLTIVNGKWTWEPANSSTHVFPLDRFTDGNYLMFQGDHFMGPNGNQLPLKDITPISDEAHAGWGLVFCDQAC